MPWKNKIRVDLSALVKWGVERKGVQRKTVLPCLYVLHVLFQLLAARPPCSLAHASAPVFVLASGDGAIGRTAVSGRCKAVRT